MLQQYWVHQIFYRKKSSKPHQTFIRHTLFIMNGGCVMLIESFYFLYFYYQSCFSFLGCLCLSKLLVSMHRTHAVLLH